MKLDFYSSIDIGERIFVGFKLIMFIFADLVVLIFIYADFGFLSLDY
jgi:hypothetical protein